MISLMYVSVSTLSCGEATLQTGQIVEGSIRRNAGLAVTGALVFTGTHYAQALEGNATNVDDLMASISRDQRHRNVTVVDRSTTLSRRFANWEMAYHGDAGYVQAPITRLLGKTAQSNATSYVNRIYAIMSEFAGRS